MFSSAAAPKAGMSCSTSKGTARFGPEARLSSGRPFRRVFTDGRKCVGRSLILWWAAPESKSPGARLGLSVPAKVGGAVQRNRLKRLVRESFRLNRRHLEGGDFIVYLRPGCSWDGLAAAERDFIELARKAGALRP